jgi:hypothetical protein
MLAIAAVGQIKSGDIHAGFDEAPDGDSRIAGRAYGTNYLGSSFE